MTVHGEILLALIIVIEFDGLLDVDHDFAAALADGRLEKGVFVALGGSMRYVE